MYLLIHKEFFLGEKVQFLREFGVFGKFGLLVNQHTHAYSLPALQHFVKRFMPFPVINA